ncbi:DUF6844 domain-containing protein [Alkalimarinus sediminis]|uniref:DUF6844 domain-containing protein n=1 Tax=Alkalimarinus sediminis TaxID=1632866 RepID=A0A9E8HGT4_9ALTE|nr:hypothetical protein [Alkalimarinus sediminis]UZW73960.1 hypothetical protein NNL22_13095 [Alkalimarinus sediminis]
MKTAKQLSLTAVLMAISGLSVADTSAGQIPAAPQLLNVQTSGSNEAADSTGSNSSIEVQSTNPSNMFPIADQLSANDLEIKRDNYLSKRGMKLGQNIKYNDQGAPVKQYYIGWGQANISLSPTDVAFADARVAAFESALLAAKGEFVKSKRRQIASESMQRFFQDERDFDPEQAAANDDYLNRMTDKIATLAETKLDELLAEAGQDPSKFGAAEKKRLAEDSFQKTISVKALSNVAGVRTLASFEDQKSVGVIIVYSQKLEDQAKEISRGKSASKSQPIAGKPSVAEQIEASVGDKKNYIFQHGVRILTDQFGNPALVAFGQSGVRATSNDSKFKVDMAVKAAKSAAQSFASAQFSEFVNATVALEDKTQLLSSTQINQIVEDGIQTEEQQVNVGKLIDNYVKQNSRTKITGMTTIKTWTANHPDTGHLIVGEVLMWSPFTRDAATQKFNKAPAKPAKPKPAAPQNNMHQSADFESDASF